MILQVFNPVSHGSSPFLGRGLNISDHDPGHGDDVKLKGERGTSHTMTFFATCFVCVFFLQISRWEMNQNHIFRFMGHGGSILFILRSRLAPIPCNMKGLVLSPNRSRKGAAEKVLPAYAIDSTSEKRSPTPSIHQTKRCPKQYVRTQKVSPSSNTAGFEYTFVKNIRNINC